ncbi:protein of unknown function [Azospirillum baldaniorum]|uniref:Uncharacterized protein n=1 Tax=Azospirillum baldaniorum TaxID=1064539 RepID=A0A9P1JQV3_9PROT|nr:protein of unknown function [Azospirillum baldaniorum]
MPIAAPLMKAQSNATATRYAREETKPWLG